MTKPKLKPFFLYLFVLFGIAEGFAQASESLWTKLEESPSKQLQVNAPLPEQHSLLVLKADQLISFLNDVPKRTTSISSSKLIEFPNSKGELESFMVMESSVMTPELQEKFPNIRSYVGKSIKNPSSILRFSISKEKGLSSMLLNHGKTVFIEPHQLENDVYIAYINSETDQHNHDFVCQTEAHPLKAFSPKKEIDFLKNVDDGRLRTYRLALACTVEYAQFHGGTLSSVMAAMNTTMTRVNGVYERDLGISMQMVDNESIIFLGPDVDSDPFTNEDGVAMLDENQQVIDENIGSANYDIGHVFSTGGGGVAVLRSPCSNSNKAKGVTGLSSPVGDQFDVDYVCHEFGHQFGANHTQNNDCERASPSVEPGSGSTIMGYAGICAPNIQANSDDYFHGESILQIWNNISDGISSNCGNVSITGNSPPSANAGSNYVIPVSTPFILKGSGTDPDPNNVLTFTWEQTDRTPAPMPPEPTSLRGPLFRSIPPSTSPERFMPAFNSILSSNSEAIWEVLPSVERDMNFMLTVRDNSILGGNTSSDEMTVTTQAGNPFYVQTPPTWPAGSIQMLKWMRADTHLAPINAETVSVYFSEDGLDFSTVLASGIPNSGSASITIPQVDNTTNARLLIEADEHIFYNVTQAFSIGTTPDFMIHPKETVKNICKQNQIDYDFEFVTSNGFSELIDFNILGLNQLSFSVSNINASSEFTLSLNELSQLDPGSYEFKLEANSSSVTKTIDLSLIIEDKACVSAGNTLYDTSTTDVSISNENTTLLNNSNSGKPSGYSDFRDIEADLVINSDYELNVNVNTDGNFTVRTFVWIDWNQNCSFDPEESYDLGSATDVDRGPTSNTPFTFTVPANAVLGETTMRVTSKYAFNPSQIPFPCENDFDGEVEDYTINVLSSLNVNQTTIQNVAIYPNPSDGRFKIEINTLQNSPIQLTLFDLKGRTLKQETLNSSGNYYEDMDLSHLASGIYLLKLNDGSKSLTKKIIIR